MNSQDVHLFVFDNLSDWGAGYAIAGINSPQFQKNLNGFRIQTVAVSKNTITTMGGVCIKPDLEINELSPSNSSMLILPGGAAWDEGKNVEIIEIAQLFLNSAKPVAGICGATAGLARVGLLDNRRHTSNAPEYLAATQYKGAALYQETAAVTDKNLITASGMAPVDFAYHIFKCLDIYTPPVLDAWYGLFKTGRSEYYEELMKVVGI